MPTIRELLSRFRPAGAPGAPAAAGVPADRAAELAVELVPVFEALAATTAQVSAIREAAAVEAVSRRSAAAAAAVRIVADARMTADADRAAAFSSARSRATAAAAALVDDGRRAAADVERRVRRQLAGFVTETVAAARAEAGVK